MNGLGPRLFNRAVKQTFHDAIKNTKLAKMPEYQVLTKPISIVHRGR